ncbi:MAG: DUF1232 domain-containing protein [Myxococcota bacterium]|nr:DUF1232 domain-containing protein [Myxococcota bacterium]
MMQEATVTIELNPSEQRVWDRIRSRVASVREPGVGSGFIDLLLLLPDLTVLLSRLLREPRVPWGSKFVAMAGLAYVFSPVDAMPALLFGPIGLLDDLIVVAAALSSLLNRVHPDVVRSHWSGQGDALDAIQRVTGWAEDQIAGSIQLVLGRLLRR